MHGGAGCGGGGGGRGRDELNNTKKEKAGEPSPEFHFSNTGAQGGRGSRQNE